MGISKILLITGTYPPEKCGVGDYSYNLVHTQEAKDWELYYSQDWALKSLFEKIRYINSSSAKRINMQYPSVGYGLNILPHILCVYFSLFSKKLFSVTIHEFTQLGWKGKIATFIFFIFANRLIFTNEFERKSAIKSVFWVKRKSAVIKIYSNIPQSVKKTPIEKRNYDIGYFGYLRPLKGLEVFIEVSKTLREKHPEISIYVMGQTQPLYEAYCEPLLEQLRKIGVILHLNKNMEEVSDILLDTKIAYLPFPDGVSERRGSFLAVIRNGCLVVTTRGQFTTTAHEELCFFTDERMAPSVIFNLLNQDSTFYKRRCFITNCFIKNELPQSWEDVVKQYNAYLL